MPLKKRTLRQNMQDANRASLDVPAPVAVPEMDLHDPDPIGGTVHRTLQDVVDETPTQVFSDGTNLSNPIFKDAPAAPVRRRLTEAEARGQAERAERGLRGQAQAAYSDPEIPKGVSDRAEYVKNIERNRFNPTKSVEQLAQEDAERILGRKPMTPPVTGAMADAPIVPTVDRRGSNLGRAGGERRASSGNMVTATPSNVDIGEAAIKPVEDITTVEGLQAKLFPDSDAGFPRAEAQAVRDAYRSPQSTLRERATGAMQRSSMRNQEAAMLGERVNPQPPITRVRPASATSVTTPPPVENVVGTAGKPGRWATIVGDASAAAGNAAGEIYGAAKAGAYGTAALRTMAAGKNVVTAPFKHVLAPMGKTIEDIGARNLRTRTILEGLAGKSLGRRLAGGMIPRMGRNIGNLASVGEGAWGVGARATGMAADIATMEFIGRMAGASTEARQSVNATQKAQLESYKQQGQNYGFDVTGREGGDAYMQLKALVGADPKIEVKENPSLRASYEAKNRKRIQQLIRSGAIHPIATGRPTIKGNSNE